jgi:hypothetical protein
MPQRLASTRLALKTSAGLDGFSGKAAMQMSMRCSSFFSLEHLAE